MADLIPDKSHITRCQRCPLPDRTDERARGGWPWKPAQLCFFALVRTISQSSWSSEAPGVGGASFHKQTPDPDKLSQKCLSLAEDYKRKCVERWRKPSAPCRKKSEQSSHPPVEAAAWRCREMKGHTDLVSSRSQSFWLLLTSSCSLFFESAVHQIGQKKEKQFHKASISTLHDFKIMSVSFPTMIRTYTSKWRLSSKVLSFGKLFLIQLTHPNTQHPPLWGVVCSRTRPSHCVWAWQRRTSLDLLPAQCHIWFPRLNSSLFCSPSKVVGLPSLNTNKEMYPPFEFSS